MEKDNNRPDQNSISNILKELKDNKLLLPEFQRNFTWRLEQTVDLFDSIFKGIFIGAFILSKPKFDLSCREIDYRPRKGKGSRSKLSEYHYQKKDFDTQDIYVLLDGQQRVTSLYRALEGIDPIYIVVKKPDSIPSPPFNNLEFSDLVDGFSLKKKRDQLSIPVSELFKQNIGVREKEIRNNLFSPSWEQLLEDDDPDERLYDDSLKENYFDILITIRIIFF